MGLTFTTQGGPLSLFRFMAWLIDPNIWMSLLTLTALEIVLGIDNIIFISIVAGKLAEERQDRARTLGLLCALGTRVLLLCSIFGLTRLTTPLFALLGHSFSGKDLVMIAGGLFLLTKSVREIHAALEAEGVKRAARRAESLASVVAQIVVIDIVFSFDSVITAVGLARNLAVMIAAVVLAMAVMLLAAGPISDFIKRHPTIKMLALAFLLLVGVVLIADGCGQHIEKGYVYFAMAFSFGVEMLNIRVRTRAK